MVHKTFISLISPLHIITALNTVAIVRIATLRSKCFQLLEMTFLLEIERQRIDTLRNGYWTQTKGKQHSSNKINSRSSGVMKTDVCAQTRDEEPYSTGGELPWITSFVDPHLSSEMGHSEAMPSSISAPAEIDDCVNGPLSRDNQHCVQG